MTTLLRWPSSDVHTKMSAPAHRKVFMACPGRQTRLRAGFHTRAIRGGHEEQALALPFLVTAHPMVTDHSMHACVYLAFLHKLCCVLRSTLRACGCTRVMPACGMATAVSCRLGAPAQPACHMMLASAAAPFGDLWGVNAHLLEGLVHVLGHGLRVEVAVALGDALVAQVEEGAHYWVHLGVENSLRQAKNTRVG